MSQREAIIRDFVDAFNANDLERIMAFFEPEAIYHNIPIEPVQGVEAIRGVIQGFLGLATKVDWTIHNLAETAGGTILTERTDRFFIGEQWVALPVMGAFDVADGKIKAWRDYFDMQQFRSQLPTSPGASGTGTPAPEAG